MRYEHGERIDINWDSEPYEVTPEYIKGHVTESEASAALEAYERGYGEGPMTLRHIYGRWVFSESDEYDRELNIYAEPKRGAFKLTEVIPNAALAGQGPTTPERTQGVDMNEQDDKNERVVRAVESLAAPRLTDEQVWLSAYCAVINTPDSDNRTAAIMADKAVSDFRKRFSHAVL